MITVFGSINMDLIATTDRLPKPGETVAGHTFTTAAGGKGANQALAATRAGATVKMAGAVGDDAFATGALELLAEGGADLSLTKTASVPTGTAHILVSADGENVIVVVPGANGEVSEADADKAVAATPAGSYLMLQLEVPAASVERAMRLARDKGVTTVINTAPLTGDAVRLSALADIIISNETEFELLTGISGLTADARLKAMKAMAADTGQTLIVTLGADGAVAVRDGQVYKAASPKITPVDTVGAGDTFCGYLVASLDAGMDFEAALTRAAKAGALACLKPGAQPAIPLAAEVDG